MNVSDIMTKSVSTCGPGDSLTRAAQLMWDRRCGGLPVLDAGGNVVGFVTDRDVCMAAYTQGRRLDDITVSTAMSRPARTCAAGASVEEAEDAMMTHAVRRLVVTDARGHMQGLVSIDDIARCAAAWDGGGDVDAERVALTLGEVARHTTTTDVDDPAVPGTDPTEIVESSLAALATLRDEIRVDLNLAGKEVRDRWRRLETHLRAAESRARQAQRAGTLVGLVESAKAFRSRLAKKRSPPKAKPTRSRARTVKAAPRRGAR